MANTFGPLMAPIVDGWNYLLNDQTLPSLTEFKGGASSHTTWHAKFLRSEKDRLNNRYESLNKRWSEEPEVLDLACDNILRLTLLSGIERAVAIRQSFSVLKQRFFLPVNTSGTLGEVVNQGFRKGYFKGALLNATQFLGIQYNTLLWARGSDFFTQLVCSSIFESLFHPIDTVKTILYADTTGEFKGAMDVLGRIVSENGVPHLFRGLVFRLIYNSAFLLHLRNWYEDNNWQYVSAPLWVASYGFLAIKTKLQVANTPLSFQTALDVASKGAEKGLYRGVVPFVLLNTAFSYQLFGLYSKEAQEKETSTLRNALKNNFVSPQAEKYWTV